MLVILSEAKDLLFVARAAVLRFAQNENLSLTTCTL